MMPVFTASDRNSEILAEVISLEPDFASQTATLRELLDAAAAGSSPLFPDSFVGLRKATTQQRWRNAFSNQTNALADQNRRASRQVALMRRAGPRSSVVRTLQRILADDFSGATFARDFDVSDMTFASDFIFSGCSVDGALRLDDARLLASCEFSGAFIGRELTAERTEFVGPAIFSGLDVGRAARFGFSEFGSDLTLDRARIGRELWLRNSNVAGALSMRNARVERDAGLGNCVYGGEVVLDETRFLDTVSFEGATFERMLSLDRCLFAGRVRLQDTKLASGISVLGTRFEGEVIPPVHEVAPRPSPQHDLFDRLRGRNFQ
jgi:hypothetical protein